MNWKKIIKKARETHRHKVAEERYICDSEKYREDADPEDWECLNCALKETNIGVGFSLYGTGIVEIVERLSARGFVHPEAWRLNTCE
jgi:hypothetical protein